MFGGSERRRSSNVRFKQLFHELKQQFPTIPDEVIANCISSSKDTNIVDELKSRVTSRCSSEEPMGRPSIDNEVPSLKPEEPDRRASVPEDSPRKKVLEGRRHKRSTKTVKEDCFFDYLEGSSPDTENNDGERGSRKLSSLLRKTVRSIKIPTKIDHKLTGRKHNNHRKQQSKRDSEDSSPRESSTSPTDQEEAQASPTVSALKETFEPKTNGIRERKTPPRVSSSATRRSEMSKSAAESTRNSSSSTSSPKRPTSLALNSVKSDGKGWKNGLQLSEKCRNVPKLLNANLLSDKPPRSPVYNKKAVGAKGRNGVHDSKVISSPGSDKEETPSVSKDSGVNTGARKKETVSTPTQTTETLLGDPTGGSVNVSFNVNCSLDVIQSPVNPKRTSTLQVTPETPWGIREPTSPRSYTTVNLTLRPPCSTPQPPIDITSQNSSLTYSTSSFDSEKGLQKRLQITVGPTGGNVIASRVRPEGCEFEVSASTPTTFDVPVRRSVDGMAAYEDPPVVVKQQAMIERLRILLTNEKTRLTVLRQEVADLERKAIRSPSDIQKWSLMKHKIAHLRYQCRGLVPDGNDTNEPEFYPNIYRGQQGILIAPDIRTSHQNDYYQQDHDGPKWSCDVCTFHNHPQLNKCEQCDMPRFIHVSAAPGDNIHIHVSPRISRRIVRSWQ
ncbi:TGF-beta-activated kinase 1 and MAP3K7-binding protein 2 isoform X2 [Harmonia axyridis]|nr:TGF-beta-activated kinase 1 and MAP3K7-binding protein 2 isoform X2 [Harmonia axyridis]